MTSKNKKRFVLVIAVLTLLIFLHFIRVIRPVENFLIGHFLNFQAGIYDIGNKFSYSFMNLSQSQKILTENQELTQKFNDLLYDNNRLKDMELENNNLKALLNYFDNQNFEYVVAKVLGRDINKDNTMIINRGSEHGVTAGQSVIVGNGILVGRIIDVKANLSTVLLLTDSSVNLSVTKPSLDHSIGIAKGEFGLSLGVDLIPQNERIEIDDTLITSGLEGDIPRGLVIGQVNRMIENENELFKSATIKTLINYKNISLVSVIIGS